MSNLQRYGNFPNSFGNLEMLPADNGSWVKFDDIKELLNTAHNNASSTFALSVARKRGIVKANIAGVAVWAHRVVGWANALRLRKRWLQ
jgi:hypothetical protein